ncbi:MAG: HNH endonuclease signature motif containing protein, partial [Ancrocorticia sp.]|uniref:HNH endonuclease signature motif containing protein n=1 Tax=Ancrocorticia sp. TaxID=2593684 RepID=UPI003F93F585
RDSGQNSVSSDIHRVAQGGNLNTTAAGNASFHHTDSGQATGEDLFSSIDGQQGPDLFSNSDNPIAGTGTSHHGSTSLGERCPETGELGPEAGELRANGGAVSHGGLRQHVAGSPDGVGESCPHDNTSPETTKTGRKKVRDRVGETFDVGQPPDWARPQASPGELRLHGSESGSGRDFGVEHAPGTGAGVEPGHVSPSGPGCPTTGRGLGRQGACLDGRENVERDLGAVLAEIRAGIDVDMLEGYSPARLSDGTPLAPTQLAELLCDSDIARVVLTAHGEPIDTSRSQRLFSSRQARAVAARDRACRYPGCSRGIEVSQIHHAQQWEKGGLTTMDNAVLLCFHHHRYVHSKQVIITHHAGGFTFTEPDGELVGITHHTTILEAA